VEDKKVYKVGDLFVEERVFEDKDTKKEIKYQNYYTVVNGLKIDVKSADKTGRQVLDQIERKEIK
jgi:hypothetical protein